MNVGTILTADEREALLDALRQTWNSRPALRLGQLLVCATGGHNLFMVSDLELLAMVGEFRLIK